AADKNKASKNKAKGRTKALLNQSGPGSSSSPVGGHACSSEQRETPQKRARQDDSVVDLTDSEAKFVLPNCFGARGFLEKYPPVVA
ncbi:hypothetical protein A2U01_0085471, partial [Trifolium medium]|nr:hypothetical protein [Trifolium medium]